MGVLRLATVEYRYLLHPLADPRTHANVCLLPSQMTP
ncbi:hypothetical protein SALBM135S_05405 [Streptomyces alboniger]